MYLLLWNLFISAALAGGPLATADRGNHAPGASQPPPPGQYVRPTAPESEEAPELPPSIPENQVVGLNPTCITQGIPEKGGRP